VNACTYCRGPLCKYDRECSSCGAPNPAVALLAHEIETLVARGQQALQQARPADAIESLSRAVAMEPEVFDAYFYMAAAWNQLGNSQRALDAMMRARAIRPGNAALHYNIGMLTGRLGERPRARWHLLEAVRLLAHGSSLADKQQFFVTIVAELERLGPITQDEIAVMKPWLDGEGHPHNPELAQVLGGVGGGENKGLVLRFYVAMVRSFLLVPSFRDGKDGNVIAAAVEPASVAVGMITGPDQKPWFPAFTDAAALRAFRPGRPLPFTGLPGVVVAGMALRSPETAGIVLNPTNDGRGQPLERRGVTAVAEGRVLRITL